MFAAIDPTFVLSNRIEAGLWIGISVILLVAQSHLRGMERKDALIAACGFAVFGISDLVEARTGAWWRPWWLLVWKGLCVVLLLVLLIRHTRRRKRRGDR